MWILQLNPHPLFCMRAELHRILQALRQYYILCDYYYSG